MAGRQHPATPAITLAAILACALASASFCAARARAQAPAQASAKEAYRLAELKFIGLNRFTGEQVSVAMGLRVGDRVGPARLAAAADLLAKSGAFDDVNFRYSSDAGALTAEFRVVETQKVLPCVFDNFVWFSDEQLDQALRKRVPFYAGVAPESGGTVEQVRVALRDIIRADGIQGEVEETPSSAGIGQPVSRFVFRVTGVPMPIRTASFPGASVVSENDLVVASKEIFGQDFSSTFVSTFASSGLLPIYRRRGYLRARFEQPQVKIIQSSADPAHPEIAVTIPVAEGSEFLWAKAEWEGNRQFSAEDLDRMLGMKPREVANAEKVEAGLAAIANAYQKRGFIDAAVRNRIILEDDTRMASWDVSIDEGAQYRLGKVIFAGLTERASQQLTRSWKLKPGEVYDGSYALDFMKEVAPAKLIENGVKNMRSSMKLERDKQNAVVDLYIVFR
jgi:outer membrane protein assembly factor BamA